MVFGCAAAARIVGYLVITALRYQMLLMQLEAELYKIYYT